MTISSPAFTHNKSIPAKYTCDGDDINPPLEISEVPESAKGLVLIVDDPDAPRGTWVHWTVWSVDPVTVVIPEGVTVIDIAAPQSGASLAQHIVGREGITDFGKPGYGGPCPPAGTHRYFFKVYALDIPLFLQPNAKKSDIEEAMEGHILAQAELVGFYAR